MLPRILIITPTADCVEPETIASVAAQDYPPELVETMVNVQEGKSKTGVHVKDLYANCTANMNVLRKKALSKKNWEYVLTLDSDVVLPPHALTELAKQARPVVGGWYRMVNAPYFVAGRWVGDNLFVNYTHTQPGLVEVDMVGHGCMLLKREVLKKIKFEPGTEYICQRATDGAQITLGACGVFGNRCAENGFRMFMCGNVLCGHKNRATGKIVK